MGCGLMSQNRHISPGRRDAEAGGRVHSMSVMGELTRHLEGLIDALADTRQPRLDALRGALLGARPAGPAALSDSADRILEALDGSGLLAAGERDTRRESATGIDEAADTLATLCRVVLGRHEAEPDKTS